MTLRIQFTHSSGHDPKVLSIPNILGIRMSDTSDSIIYVTSLGKETSRVIIDKFRKEHILDMYIEVN